MLGIVYGADGREVKRALTLMNPSVPGRGRAGGGCATDRELFGGIRSDD